MREINDEGILEPRLPADEYLRQALHISRLLDQLIDPVLHAQVISQLLADPREHTIRLFSDCRRLGEVNSAAALGALQLVRVTRPKQAFSTAGLGR